MIRERRTAASVYPDRNNFAPRFGFAWDMLGTGKLVMRGGFGIFYDIEDGALNLQFGGQPPFGDASSLYPSSRRLRADHHDGSIYLLRDYTIPIPLPKGGVGTFFIPKVSFAYVMDPTFRTPYSENFNFGFQYQLTPNMMLEGV